MYSEEFTAYKKGIATTAVRSRTGRRLQAQVITMIRYTAYYPYTQFVIHLQEMEQFQAAEDKKESELILVIGIASDNYIPLLYV